VLCIALLSDNARALRGAVEPPVLLICGMSPPKSYGLLKVNNFNNTAKQMVGK
jgi:hypothetical protein